MDGFSNIITQISTVVASANSQIDSQKNDFFADEGRASALVAQDTVVAGIDELLRSPNDAAANAFSSGFDPASLASEFEASLPTFNVAAGRGSEIIAALDRTLVENNQSTGPFNVLANDKHLSGGAFDITGIYAFKSDALADADPHNLDVGQNENQVNPFNTISGSFSSQAALLQDGLIEFTPDEIGRYNLYYIVSDGADYAIGTLVVDVVPSAPTLSISDGATLAYTETTQSGVAEHTDIAIGQFLNLANVADFNDPQGSSLLSYRFQILQPLEVQELKLVLLMTI